MKYARLQLKRIIICYPKIFASSLLIFIVIGIVSFVKLSSYSKDDVSTKLKLGLVGEDPSGYLDLGISTLKNLDNFRFVVEFIRVKNEREAEKMLSSGALSCYAVIPDNFINSLIYGENSPVTIVVRQSEVSIGVLAASELLDSISSLITETEAGIYTYHDFYTQYLRKRGEKQEKLELDLNIEYLKRILARGNLFQVTELTTHKSISPQAYYFCVGLLFYLFLWSLCSIFLYIRKNNSMQKMLYARGSKIISILTSEWISCFVLMLLCFIPIFIALIIFSGKLCILIPELKDISKLYMFFFILSFLPVFFFCVSIEIFIAEFCHDIISSISLQFTITVFMSYISGFFYPIEILPKSISSLSKIFPYFHSFSLCSGFLKKEFNVVNLLLILGYAILFFVFAYLLKRRSVLTND